MFLQPFTTLPEGRVPQALHSESPTLAPPEAPPLTFLSSMVAAVGHATSTPQGAHCQCLQLRWWSLPDLPPAPLRSPAVDVFNIGGGRCRTCHHHPLGGPPSTSSTSVVVTVGHAASTPQGARRRRLQHWWWPMSDMPPAPPRGAHR
jgi:hypothetical protein